MSMRLAVLLAAFGGISVLIALAFIVPAGDPFARAVAVVALATPIARWAWDRNVLLAANKEQVRIENPHIGHLKAGWFIEITVVNQSSFTLPIKSVELLVRERSSPCDLIVAYPLSTDGSLSVDLPQRKAETFLLQALPIEQLREICQLPEEDVWLSVSTHAGEVNRLHGFLLQLIFSQIITVREKMFTDPLPPELADIL